MGTRSLTHIKQDGLKSATLCTIYRQFDGYPSGMGVDLAEIIAPRSLVNGISGDAEKVFNGMECAAAQIIRQLKTESAGNVYIYPADSDDCSEQYTYTVYAKNGEIRIKCKGMYGPCESGFDLTAKEVLAKYEKEEAK